MTKSEKFDFLIWNNECLYGYKINTDELTLITDTLDCCETEFTGFTADDNGNIYCVVYGSNTLYSIVPIDRIIDSEENDPEQIPEKSEVFSEEKDALKQLNPETNESPDIDSSLTENQALQILSYYGYNVQTKIVFDDTVCEGYVVKTEPASWTELPPGSDVMLYISRGKMSEAE